ncbi:MAG: TonB-dependent receptor plug domain-containing protein [Alistipes sp.]|nr:TonB-dependent receptor plug domain-containing protein [Alistipes sp.]
MNPWWNRLWSIGAGGWILLATPLVGYTQTAPQWGGALEEVSVTARRLTETGITRTVIDSATLRTNVAHSLADVLTQNTPLFIKSYGRGSMATASFRGTAPSHTQVDWNGLRLNSPMLGMVDFSLIPSYFVDEATLYHGAGSVEVAGGALGGAITLNNRPTHQLGWETTFIQGVSSFKTYDEFLRVGYNQGKWQTLTRFSYTSSDNDFKYRNYDKIGEDGELYPVERNRNGEFREWHGLQEFYYTPAEGHRLGLAVWVMDSKRGIPMTSVNYRDEDQSKNRMDETTLRIVGSWDRSWRAMSFAVKAGFATSDLLYRLWNDMGAGSLVESLHARSRTRTGYTQATLRYAPSPKWLITGGLSLYLHAVRSRNTTANDTITEGYDRCRMEGSLCFGTKYRPDPRITLGVDLRGENYGRRLASLIPAVFADFTLWPRYEVVFRGSAARNYHAPSLNDLYFQPGGNDSLQCEKGYTYEGALSFALRRHGWSLTGQGTIYNGWVTDWILWLPTRQGYWTPTNINRVHSYGVELTGNFEVNLGREWRLSLNGQWAKTRSLNQGAPKGSADASVGKQLVYVPEFSASANGTLSWRGYALSYRFYHYSERFTTSSNESSQLNRLSPYYMNDLYVEKRFAARIGTLSVKFCVYNLYDEHYVSVLSRPMPGRNFGLFLGITPRW